MNDNKKQKPKKPREPEKLKRDTQSKGYQITINNPKKHGFTRESVKEILLMMNPVYFAISSERGFKQRTPHFHAYWISRSAIRFSTVQNRFGTNVHIESALGSPTDNRNYLRKEGKHATKKETLLDFEEWGDLPLSAQETKEAADERVLEYVKDGKGVIEIIETEPKLWKYKKHIDELAYAYAVNKWSKECRDVIVTFISSRANVGKTSFVLSQMGYGKVFHMTNYKQKHSLFDGYDSLNHETILMDEYTGQIDITDMNIYLDRFPITNAPARFQNKVLTAKYIFICSNLPFSRIYSFERQFEPLIYAGFERRVHNIWEFQREPDSDILKIVKHKHTKDIDVLDTTKLEFIERSN